MAPASPTTPATIDPTTIIQCLQAKDTSLTNVTLTKETLNGDETAVDWTALAAALSFSAISSSSDSSSSSSSSRSHIHSLEFSGVDWLPILRRYETCSPVRTKSAAACPPWCYKMWVWPLRRCDSCATIPSKVRTIRLFGRCHCKTTPGWVPVEPKRPDRGSLS